MRDKGVLDFVEMPAARLWLTAKNSIEVSCAGNIINFLQVRQPLVVQPLDLGPARQHPRQRLDLHVLTPVIDFEGIAYASNVDSRPLRIRRP